jgi:hypothetical protein
MLGTSTLSPDHPTIQVEAALFPTYVEVSSGYFLSLSPPQSQNRTIQAEVLLSASNSWK